MIDENEDAAPAPGSSETVDWVEDAIAAALDAADFDAFRGTLEDMLSAPEYGFEFDTPDGKAMLACALGRRIWNVTPRPDNDFRPTPVAAPSRNARCLIGLNCKVKQCCGTVPAPPPLTAAFVWSVLADRLEADELGLALEHKRVPRSTAPLVASILVDEDPRLARGVLEALYADSLDRCDDNDGPMLLALCDAYDALDQPAEKQALLERMITVKSVAVQSDGWQRLATIAADAGDPPRAWAAYRSALRIFPDDIWLGPLELSLLVAENRIDAAKERACALHADFTRAGDAADYPELLALYAKAMTDPVAALAAED